LLHRRKKKRYRRIRRKENNNCIYFFERKQQLYLHLPKWLPTPQTTLTPLKQPFRTTIKLTNFSIIHALALLNGSSFFSKQSYNININKEVHAELPIGST
jgi:hypothetical protein